MKFNDYVQTISAGSDLDRTAAAEFLGLLLDNPTVSDDQIAEALTALTKKSPTVAEVCGFVDAMQARMTKVLYDGEAIDTCGTGGDKSGSFNISTASAILLAAGGVAVAKHGNRAATSQCGSADVLEALGIPVNLPAAAAAQALEAHQFVFLFAQLYHPSLKRLAGIRKQLGFPTVFNVLGPLLNPAGVKRQVIGTFSQANARLLAEVVAQLDYHQQVLILTSADGLDEASLAAPVDVYEFKNGTLAESTIQATDYGLQSAPLIALAGGDAATNAQLLIEVLQPAAQLSPKQQSVIFNAGLAFYVAGQAANIADGIQRAKQVLSSGKADAKLNELQRIT